MKSVRLRLATAVALGLVTLSAASAFACGSGGGKRGGGFGGGFGGVSGLPGGIGGVYNQRVSNPRVVNQGNYDPGCENGGGYGQGPYNSPGGGYQGQAYEPFHSYYIVEPGDSFYTVSLKEYGTSANANHIARFNRMAPNAALVLGQRLMMPSISANGRLGQSRAAAPEGMQASSPKFSVPAQPASAAKSAAEESLPEIVVGSMIMIDGTVLGDEQGVVRLKVSGIAFPVEVAEWTSSAAKVRLPELEVTSPTKAEIEVLRADGTVASTTRLELMPKTDRLAHNN